MDTILNLLLEMTLYSSAMILAVLLIKTMWQSRINSIFISLLWLVVLVRLLVPGIIESPVNLSSVLPESDIYDQNDNTAVNDNIEMSPIASQSQGQDAAAYNTDHASSNDITAAPIEGAQLDFIKTLKSISTKAYILFIWLIGLCFVLIKNVLAMIAFNKKIQTCSTISTDYLDCILTKAKAKTNTKVKVQLMNCDFVDMPVSCGVIRPKVLLPVGYAGKLSPDKLELVLSHELYHIKRGDMLKNYLWLAAKAIHWFNPLVWIAYSSYKDDVEMVVDDMMLKNSSKDQAVLYSQSILDVLTISTGSKNKINAPLALTLVNDKDKLKKRIKEIVKPMKKKKSLCVFCVIIIAVMIVAGFTTACSMVRGNLEDTKEQISEMERVKLNIQPEDNVRILANVKFTTPEYDSLNIITFEQQNLQAEHLDALIDYICPGNKLYKADGSLYEGELSDVDPYNYKSFTSLNTTINGQEALIELKQSLPQNENRTQLSFYYVDADRNTAGLTKYVWKELDDYTYEDHQKIDEIHAKCQITADEFVKALDGEDTSLKLVRSSLAGGDLDTPINEYVYKRIYPNLDTVHTSSYYIYPYHRNVEIAFTETMYVYATEEGIIEMQWNRYQPEYEVIQKNVELMDVNDIARTFENECQSFHWEYNMFDLTPDVSVTINIKKVVLDNIVVVENNEVITVPVWNFIGDVEYDTPVYYDDTEIPCSGMPDMSIMTINAIDGSVIYR